jgi:hypothetical protein
LSIGKAALILQGLAAYSGDVSPEWIFGDGCRTGQTTVCAAALSANRNLWPPGAPSTHTAWPNLGTTAGSKREYAGFDAQEMKEIWPN